MNPIPVPFRSSQQLHRWLEFLSHCRRRCGHDLALPDIFRLLALDSTELDAPLQPLALLTQSAALRRLDAAGVKSESRHGFSIQHRRWALQSLQRLDALPFEIQRACQSAEGRRLLLARHLCGLLPVDSLHDLVHAFLQPLLTAASPMRGHLPPWLWDSLLDNEAQSRNDRMLA